MRGACLVLILLGALGALSAPAQAQPSAIAPAARERIDIASMVDEAALRFGLPASWIYAVIRLESGGRIDAVSPAGAMGLMQLMPASWARQRARLGLARDPFDPRDNILAGAATLRSLYDRYGTQGFLAAYNAGPGRYEDWLAGRRKLPRETLRYLVRAAALLKLPAVMAPVGNAPGGEAASAQFASSGERATPAQAPASAGPATRSERGDPQAVAALFVPVSSASRR